MNSTERVRRPTLRQLADEQDVSVAALIDRAVREHGTVDAAAKSLGLNPMSVYAWLNRNGYEVQRVSRIVRTA